MALFYIFVISLISGFCFQSAAIYYFWWRPQNYNYVVWKRRSIFNNLFLQLSCVMGMPHSFWETEAANHCLYNSLIYIRLFLIGWGVEKWQTIILMILNVSFRFSRSIASNSLWPHRLQHARPPCPSPTPGVDPTDCSTPGLPVHRQLPEFTQTHVHWVSDVYNVISFLLSISTREVKLGQKKEKKKYFLQIAIFCDKWRGCYAGGHM